MKLAILDLYDGTPNQGMRCIKQIISMYRHTFDYEVFDVRKKAEVPGLDFDVYISTGGPGNPLDGDGIWDKKYYNLLDKLWNANAKGIYPKKYVFFICHSFQMACNFFKLGSILPRHSMSFGTFPIHLTDAGMNDPIFDGLSNPFWAADFRSYQVIEPNLIQFESIGAEILALEKIRPYVPYERAIMGIRFSDEFFGVQFHPEADAAGMLDHFRQEERKNMVTKKYGRKKYDTMIRDLSDPMKIALTNRTILPNFLNKTIERLTQAVAA